MIYKSFFKRKVTKIYLLIFIIFSIVLSFLFIEKSYLIMRGNDAYKDSFIYLISDREIDLTEEKNVKAYNKAIELDCNNQLSNVYVTKDKPIIDIEDTGDIGYSECIINKYSVKYTMAYRTNIISNDKLFDDLDKVQLEYYYFITLNNWFDVSKTIEKLSHKYKVEVFVSENKIDDNNYKDTIFIFTLFIKIIVILFIILYIVSVINFIFDERKNNILYYSLGYSKICIIKITINKIILLLVIPFFLLFLSFIIGFVI